MNRAKPYSYLGAMLGTGIGFGVGYGVGLLETVGGDDIVGALLIWFYLFLILIMAGTILIMYDTVDPDVEADVASWGAAVVLIMGAFCIFFVFGEGTHDFFVRGTSLFLLVLAIPFCAFGTIKGYMVGRSIGKKADEREQERRLYQQEIREYKAKYEQLKGEGYGPDEELEELLK